MLLYEFRYVAKLWMISLLLLEEAGMDISNFDIFPFDFCDKDSIPQCRNVSQIKN